MKENETTFRDFNLEIDMLPLEVVLVDIPEPDPGKMDFRNEPREIPVAHLQQPGILTRLLDHLKSRI